MAVVNDADAGRLHPPNPDTDGFPYSDSSAEPDASPLIDTYAAGFAGATHHHRAQRYAH
jgi:hypothetical protein